MASIVIKTKVQSIYYQDKENSLGITHATSEKRITVPEAGDILLDRGIEYKEILKVKYEHLELEMPLEKIEEYQI